MTAKQNTDVVPVTRKMVHEICDVGGRTTQECADLLRKKYLEHAINASPELTALIAENEQLTLDNARMREVLKEIATCKYTSYENTSEGMYEGMYGVGVTDGHRYCANLAKPALGEQS